ncbi:MAG: hypothetical protein Q4G03_06470 [Planctomycetia bacterium]|nr:hypothetical protein [Planctomycetia bacterium]
MTESPQLQQMVDAATDALIQSQDDDGRLDTIPQGETPHGRLGSRGAFSHDRRAALARRQARQAP